jgi:hypothetical protein
VSTEPLDAVSPRALDGDAAAGFFTAEGNVLVPAEFATSPWGAVLHGRLIGGLTARAAEEARAQAPEMACSRLTVDMFRSAALAPVRVTTRAVRSGRRIAVLDVTVEQEDGLVGQGRAVLLRRSSQPEGTFRPQPDWDAPTPPQLGPALPQLGPALPAAPGRRWTPSWETWRVSPDGGGMNGGLWIRDIHPLVTGEELTPLIRVAVAADLVSPVTNSSDRGLSFINADYTVYLGREPEGEYVGIQPGGHISAEGVAAGQGVLHDLRGPVGFVTTGAVANGRMG